MKLKLNNDCNHGNSRIKKKRKKKKENLNWVWRIIGLWTWDKTILTVRIQQ